MLDRGLAMAESWDAEFGRRLRDRAADMARDARGERWPRSWWMTRLARHVWWLAAVGRTGEAHARLVNAGYRVLLPGKRP